MKMYKAAELSTIMLQNAEKMPLSNEMMYEVISLLTHTMARTDQTTHSQLSKPASKEELSRPATELLVGRCGNFWPGVW